MALDPTVAKTLTRSLLKAGASAKPYAFLYCPSDKSGDPHLQVSKKRIPASEMTKLRKSAKVKKLIIGTVSRNKETNTLEFVTKNPDKKLQKHLRSFFAPKVPPLKGAVVMKPPEGLPRLIEEVDLPVSQQTVSGKLDELSAAEKKLQEAIAEDSTADTLNKAAAALEEQADEKAEAMLAADVEAADLEEEIAQIEAEMRSKFGAGMLKAAMQSGIGLQDPKLLEFASTHSMDAIQAAEEAAKLEEQIRTEFGGMALIIGGVAPDLSEGKKAKFARLMEKLGVARQKEQTSLEQAGENGFTFAEERMKLLETLTEKREAAKVKRQAAFDLANEIDDLEEQAESKRSSLTEHIEETSALKSIQTEIEEADEAVNTAVEPQRVFSGQVTDVLAGSSAPEENLYGDGPEGQLLGLLDLGGLSRSEIRDAVLTGVEEEVAKVDLSTLESPEQWLKDKAEEARLKVIGLKTTEDRATMKQIMAVVQQLKTEKVDPVALQVKLTYSARVQALNVRGAAFAHLKKDPLEEDLGSELLWKTSMDFIDLQHSFKELLKGNPDDAFDGGEVTFEKIWALISAAEHSLSTTLDGTKLAEIESYEKLVVKAEAQKRFYDTQGDGLVEQFDQALYTRDGDRSPLLSQISSEGVCIAMCLDWASSGGDIEALRDDTGKVGISEKHLVLQSLHDLHTSTIRFTEEQQEKLDLFKEKAQDIKGPEGGLPRPLSEEAHGKLAKIEGMVGALQRRELSAGKQSSKVDQVTQETVRLSQQFEQLSRTIRIVDSDLFMTKFLPSGSEEQIQAKREQIALLNKQKLDAIEEQIAIGKKSAELMSNIAVLFTIAPPKKVDEMKLKMRAVENLGGITPDNIAAGLKSQIDPNEGDLGPKTFFNINMTGDEGGHATIVKISAFDAEVQFLDPNAGVFKQPDYAAFLVWLPTWFRTFYGDGQYTNIMVLLSTGT
ncbi:MAG: hypothetical protein ACI8RZ_001172 [Myxococcota bacterium]|jgi:hypothetical protein